MHASLFDLLHLYIFVDIGIWLPGLENHDRFKHAILRFKSMSNPILVSITSNYWTPYHNFESFQWYNIVDYD